MVQSPQTGMFNRKSQNGLFCKIPYKTQNQPSLFFNKIVLGLLMRYDSYVIYSSGFQG